MPDDQELLKAVRAGTGLEQALAEVYREYFQYLGSYVWNNQGSRQDAEDMFQETVIHFVSAVRESRFREESSVKTFLYAVNRNLWLNELKKRGRALKREMVYESGRVLSEPDLQKTIDECEDRQKLAALVEKLGEACRKILIGFYYENMSMKELMPYLNFGSEQVIRNKKYKCLKELESIIFNDPKLKNELKRLFHG